MKKSGAGDWKVRGPKLSSMVIARSFVNKAWGGMKWKTQNMAIS